MTDKADNEVAEFLAGNPDITHLDTVLIDLCGQPYGKRLPRSHIANSTKAEPRFAPP